jgi:hypothetical protein
MRIAELARVAILSMSLCACAQQPTPFDVPSSAASVERFPILNGRAFQTQFTLQVKYPATPALEYYRAHIGKPWVLCERNTPEWSRFRDAQGKDQVAVHQQLYTWVNLEAHRSLMLSMRYYSSKDSDETPDNDTQHILLVEYTGEDVQDKIKQLQLRCPSN